MAVEDDERLKNVEKEQDKAIQEVTNQYGQMINDSNKYYQAQIDAAKDYQKTQTQLQNEQTQFTTDKIEQQKAQAQKDYEREQRGAYADYQKATGQYGVNAEIQATQGLNRTGYSESTRTNAYNTYQNRYATARESYNNAVVNYDNGIKEAQLANNANLAQIAYNSLQQQLSLALEGFQYKNTLIQTRMNAINQEKDRYNTRYQQVLNQINTENSLAEQIRQYNETMAFNREKAAQEQANWERQYNETMAFNREKAAQEQANWEKQYALSLASSKSSGGGSRSSGSSGRSSSGGSSNSYSYQLTDSPENYEVNTQYYQGNLNADAKNGTFSNGYQPNNIGGKKLKKTGETMELQTQTLSGESKTVTQNVWTTDGGKTKYYWDGRQNRYIKLN